MYNLIVWKQIISQHLTRLESNTQLNQPNKLPLHYYNLDLCCRLSDTIQFLLRKIGANLRAKERSQQVECTRRQYSYASV